VIVESFERIHRSNLIGMGVLPLQFPQGESAASLGLDGTETFDISGITALNEGTTPRTVHVTATKDTGEKIESDATERIDTPGEADSYRNGGILQYVLRGMLRSCRAPPPRGPRPIAGGALARLPLSFRKATFTKLRFRKATFLKRRSPSPPLAWPVNQSLPIGWRQ